MFRELPHHPDERFPRHRQCPIPPICDSEFAPQFRPSSSSNFTRPADSSRANEELISETPRSAATKLLIMPTLGNSILTLSSVLCSRKNLSRAGGCVRSSAEAADASPPRQYSPTSLRHGILGTHHEHQSVPENGLHFQACRLDRQADDADVKSAVFQLLYNFVGEVAVDADLHIGILAAIFAEYFRQNVKAGCFVRPDQQRAAGRVPWSATATSDSSRSFFMRNAYSWNISPAGVSFTVLPERSSRRSPYSCSS